MQHDTSVLAGRTIRCILFDLGDTLWRAQGDLFEPFQRTATLRMLAILQEYIDPTIMASCDMGDIQTELHHAILKHAREIQCAQPYFEPNFAQVVNDVLPRFGLPTLAPSISAQIFSELRTPILGTRHLFRDAKSTLHALKTHGFQLGVVTNRMWGGPLFLYDIQTLGLLEHFETRFMAISADLGIRKPNPDIFRYTLKALHVAPEETVMVGDSLMEDVAPAHNLGMVTVWKPKTHYFTNLQNHLFVYAVEQESHGLTISHPQIKPDFTIEHLSELQSIFIK